MTPPGYKQTEVGVIPEEWEVKPLGEMLIKGRLGGNYPNQLQETDYPLMKMGNISRGQMDTTKVEYIGKSVTPELQHKLRNGDVLFNTRNTLDLVGKVAIWRDELPCAYYNSNLMRLEFDPRQICSNEYANAALNASGAIGILRGLATGTTSVAAIYTRDLLGMPFIQPPLPEQRAIATALSDVDGLLGALDRLIAKKRDLKQAAMQQLLTGQTRLPGFNGEWVVKTLGDVAVFYKGKGLPKSALSESGAELCIHYGELFTCYPETIGKILSRTNISAGVFRSVANDVLMPTSDVTPRGLAKASCVRVDGVILGGDILVIRSDTNLIYGSFLSCLIRYEEAQVLQLVTGSTVYHLYGSDMKNFTFSMPPLPEQTAIASVLSEMDAELAGLEHRREKTRALKQAMMQELLTGKTRLL
jgi:type I restriction enzyme, S subunit